MERSERRRRPSSSPFVRFLLLRATLVPCQLLFVLLILYLAIEEPSNLASHQDLGVVGFFAGFSQMVVNDFTGNWGVSTFAFYQGIPLVQLYAWMLPPSVELGAIALGISAAIAYPVSMWAGWTRRPGADAAVQVTSFVGTMLPVFIVGILVITALFFGFLAQFNDFPDMGVIPTPGWWFAFNGTMGPAWIVDTRFTQPTGFPLVDGLIHGAWAFEWVTLVKTLIQASIIAIVYVTIFLRHARAVVHSASQEAHVDVARSRGVPERTLLWKHTARRVAPTFLMVLALTFPAYLGTQFVVEATFLDNGIGFLALSALTGQGSAGNGLALLETMMFLLALLVVVWLFVVDLVVRRSDPRGR
jgi:ABC-type dipeptide/oligopeptide/nickel transport system permease component